jgi:hypothetical protein
MQIGTMRVEEAKVFDSEAGYHQFHNEDGAAYGSFEVLWIDAQADCRDELDDEEGRAAGWYWAPGFPGCLWDGDPCGPFATSYKARADADEHWEG